MTHTHKLVQDASGTVAIARSEVEAERIAACLEACDGIATESLTGAIAKRLTWATEAERSLRELVRICEAVRYSVGLQRGQLDRIERAKLLLQATAAALCEEGR